MQITLQKNNKDKFISILNLIRGIVYEVDINFSADAMIVKAIHSTKSNMLFLELKKNFFEEYNIEKEVTYTIDLDDLIKIIKVCKEDIYLEPGIDDIQIKSKRNKFKLKYYVGNKDEREKPNINYTTKLKMKVKDFFNVIRSGISFDTIGNFIIDEENNFKIYMKNHKLESEMHIENVEIEGSKISNYFDLELLSLSMELEKLFDIMVLNFGEDVPLTINCENEVIKANFVLANRMTSNE